MDNTKVAADLVLRYLIAKSLFRGAVFKPPPNLEHQIRGGVRYLARGVLLNEVTMGRTPAIIHDRKDPDFWAAVIGGDDGAIDMEPAQLNEVRRVVLYDEGTLPLPEEGEELAEQLIGGVAASALSNSVTIQSADPRKLRTKVRLSRRHRAVQFVMRCLVIGHRAPDRLKGGAGLGV
jgi:hypothetical protein